MCDFAGQVLSLPKKDFNAQLRKYETDFIRRAGRVYTAQGHFQKKTGTRKKIAQVPGFAASASGSAEDANIPLLGKQYGSIILSDNDSEEARKKRIEAMLADEEAKVRIWPDHEEAEDCESITATISFSVCHFTFSVVAGTVLCAARRRLIRSIVLFEALRVPRLERILT